MPDSPPAPEYVILPLPEAPPRHKIETVGKLWGWIGACPHAQTLEAWSARFACTVWIPLPCKQWSCRLCADQKIKTLSFKTQEAKPNRLLTLTVDPSLWDSPRHAFDGTRRKVPECIRSLRKRFHPIEYLRVTELTAKGWPHYHLLVRSPYIPHAVVRDTWKQLTGAFIVDLRQVKEHFAAYNYLVKYLSKMHKIGWTERHVSYSRAFFPPPEKPVPEDLDLEAKTIIEAHPSTYLAARFRGAHLTQIGYNIFALDPKQAAVDDLVDHDDWSTCAEEPPREQIFPEKTPVVQKPQPVLFPKTHEVSDV